MGHSVADSRASSRQASADQPLRIVLADAQPASGLSVEAQAAQQWQVVPMGEGAGTLSPASPSAAVPVPSIGGAGADSAASPSRHRMSQQSHADDPETQRTWLSRIQNRTTLLQQMFDLEATEVCVLAAMLALLRPLPLPPGIFAGEKRWLRPQYSLHFVGRPNLCTLQAVREDCVHWRCPECCPFES